MRRVQWIRACARMTIIPVRAFIPALQAGSPRCFLDTSPTNASLNDMEIRLPPEQEAHLAAIAATTGRSTEELVQEALELWEQQNANMLAEFRKTLDAAEASLAEGKGRIITQQSMRDLADEVHRRGLARLEAEQKPPR
jgi:predicted DNA-binding protein